MDFQSVPERAWFVHLFSSRNHLLSNHPQGCLNNFLGVSLG